LLAAGEPGVAVGGAQAPSAARPAPAARPPHDAVIDRDLLVDTLFPLTRRLIQLGYYTSDVEGLEHVPTQGPVVFASNHAGWFPFDAFYLTFVVSEAFGLRRAPFFATHEAAVGAPILGSFLRRCGALPASWFRRPERLPPEVESCGIFPEGVRGNTKPFWQAYRMKEWNRGFVRVAIARGAPIVPVACLGSEETTPVAWTVRLLEPLLGASLGLPLAPIPLPAHWKIIFHRPVHVAGKGQITDQAFCTEVARSCRAIVQATLDREAPARALGRLSRRVGRGGT
ncbi:MAG TPA: 1-acyl-sn-glycerol-3-phosphate acyltransferase, partial [Anaeromyxobacteraceae bacterium]|nr:1-acyl-sn-glycerol-3-phosphate acyltransferase [Anaeromyxobacteraceae bacterium]